MRTTTLLRRLLVLAVCALAARGAAAADPFYLARMSEGIEAYARGDATVAARQLQLACFGLLDEPELLTECLVHLGRAQAEAGDRTDFVATFNRLLEVEERFQAYSKARLPAGLRADFEERLLRLIPERDLVYRPAFSHLAARKAAGRLARLPPRQRREELARRLAEEPDQPLWRLLQAELELEDGNHREAAAQASALLAIEPGWQRAGCIRGLALAQTGDCTTAVGDLDSCDLTRRTIEPARALLECQIELGRWRDADRLLAALPAEIAANRRITRLARQVERGLADQPDGGAEATELAAEDNAETGDDAMAMAGGNGSAPTLPTAADRSRLAQIRTLMNDARHAGELVAALDQASALAAEHPGWRDAQHLSAEISYRASRWQEAVDYFRRGGDPGEDQPVLLFYLAVALYETGAAEEAAATLERALPGLDDSPFIRRYREQILGPRATGEGLSSDDRLTKGGSAA